MYSYGAKFKQNIHKYKKEKAFPLSDVWMMFCPSIIHLAMRAYISHIPMNLNQRVLLREDVLLHILLFFLILARMENHKLYFFKFPIVNSSFLSSSIPSAPSYGISISQLIRYLYLHNTDFMKGVVLQQSYERNRRKSTLNKFNLYIRN